MIYDTKDRINMTLVCLCDMYAGPSSLEKYRFLVKEILGDGNRHQALAIALSILSPMIAPVSRNSDIKALLLLYSKTCLQKLQVYRGSLTYSA